MWIARYLFLYLTRFVISLRYKVEVHGWPEIRDLKSPILLLPNHPGLIDPVIVLATFYGRFRPRTVLYEGNFPGAIGALLLSLVRAVAIPDLKRPSQEAVHRTEQAVNEIFTGLRSGENFLLWPSGRAQRAGIEQLGSAKALADILQGVPEANVILIRTRGVWGSMFSCAPTGKLPKLTRQLMRGALLLLANLLFLAPRRKIDITVETLDRSQLPSLDRDVVNRWFERWYNPEGPESPVFVPYHFLFGPRQFEFPKPPTTEEAFPHVKIRPEVNAGLSEILTKISRHPVKLEELTPQTKLESLGFDSLQLMEITLAVEQRFSVTSETSPETIGQLARLAQGLADDGPPKPLKPSAHWFDERPVNKPLEVLGKTIPEAFIARALLSPRNVAAADDLSGALTYRRLLTAAVILSRRFAQLPGERVGLMLPASVASDTMLMGLYFANKTPVLLNWTTGPANLSHAVKVAQVTHVVTSRLLRDRLNISIEGVSYLDAEDLKKSVGQFEALSTLFRVICFPQSIRAMAPPNSSDSVAVVLFTSGSEKRPKGVPLTHGNVLSNLRSMQSILPLANHDAILGFLPMFHSFGFTMTGLYPLLGGIRVVHHPDPTDTTGVVRKIAAYKATVLAGMPSLISHLIDKSQQGELDSLKYIAVGAEKCPLSLFHLVQRKLPNAMLLEGYGITECSPGVSANTPKATRIGTLGRPMDGVEVCVVDLETRQVLPPGKMGMLQVHGPSVFPGYLGDEESPFVEHDGKRWYVTGDLAQIDDDGYIHFSGRLKRFVKAGGEMISLPALEEPLAERFPPDEDGPQVAVEGIEKDNGRRIVLFARPAIELREANDIIAQAGFRGVMRLDEVRHLNRLPLLGTGKVDYKVLRSQIS